MDVLAVSAMEWVALALALLGLAIAVVIPLLVEYSRRPSLVIEPYDDLNLDRDPKQRLVHIRVVNRPLTGWRSRYLLRNVATGCTLRITFRSESDRSSITMAGRWSGHAEPRMTSLVLPEPPQPASSWTIASTLTSGSMTVVMVEPADVLSSRVIDLQPSDEGQVAGIAVKSDGDRSAHAFASESYSYARLAKPEWELPHERYTVEIVAEAGGVRSPVTLFTLENEGTDYRGLKLRAH